MSEYGHRRTVGRLAGIPIRIAPTDPAVTEGRQVACRPGEFDILAAMAAEPERASTRRQLPASTRGDDARVTERTIDEHVLDLARRSNPPPPTGPSPDGVPPAPPTKRL